MVRVVSEAMEVFRKLRRFNRWRLFIERELPEISREGYRKIRTIFGKSLRIPKNMRGEGEEISVSFTAFFSAVGSGLNSTENSEEPIS
jgi:hypothetical protein